MADPAERLRQIENSRGLRVTLEMNGLLATYYTFSHNSRPLMSVLKDVKGSGSQLFDADKPETLSVVQMEITRLIHNWVAAGFTLVDHTRNVVKRLYGEDGFAKEYQQKVDEIFKKSDTAGFVQGLRNWMLHKGLLPVSATLNLGPHEAKCSVVFDLERLRVGSKWDQRAKRYLASLSIDPPVHGVVDAYVAMVVGFYSWLEGRVIEIERANLDEYNRLIERRRNTPTLATEKGK